MTKDEKKQLVVELKETLKERPNIYLADAGGLTVAEVSQLRRMCHEAGVKMQVVKNTLLKKALDDAEGDYEEIYGALKSQSSVFFVGENLNAPAKIIKEFRGKKGEVPSLKGAYIDSAIFLGDQSLGELAALKSKQELIGDILGLLQSPIRNVMGSLDSGKNTLTGLLKSLGDRPE